MKNLYILSAVFLAMLVVVVYSDDTPIEPIPAKCPKKDPFNSTVHIAHETNCSLFYACQNGRKILLCCPELNEEGDRLYFNPLLQVCDWPENVECENKPAPGDGEGEEGEGEEGPGEGEGEEGKGEEGKGEEGNNPPPVRDSIINRMWMNRV